MKNMITKFKKMFDEEMCKEIIRRIFLLNQELEG